MRKIAILVIANLLWAAPVAQAREVARIQSAPGQSQASWNASAQYQAFQCPTGTARGEGVDMNYTSTRSDDFHYAICVELWQPAPTPVPTPSPTPSPTPQSETATVTVAPSTTVVTAIPTPTAEPTPLAVSTPSDTPTATSTLTATQSESATVASTTTAPAFDYQAFLQMFIAWFQTWFTQFLNTWGQS